jgi:serine/threonine protein kinase
MTDARSDIYALGATLYQVLTGETPPESALRAVSSLTLPPLRQLNPAISPGVEAAILTAMQIPTEQRYQRVSDLRKALLQPPQPIFAQTQQAATIAATPQTMIAPPVQPQPQPVQAWVAAPIASPKPASSLAWLPILAGLALVAILVTGGLIFLLPRLAATATSEPATLVVVLPAATDTPPPAPPPSATTAPRATSLPVPSATRTQSQSQPTATTRPSATTVPATPTPAGPTMLLMDQGYNCRGGPGGSYELIWTFEEGALKEIIGRTSDNSWWLVRIDDSRTRRQQCWVGGGIPQGNTSQVPISNWTGTVDTAKTPWP